MLLLLLQVSAADAAHAADAGAGEMPLRVWPSVSGTRRW